MADSSQQPLPRPAQHPGERLASYFDNFFKTIIGISTFGASLTFTKIVETPVEPWTDYGISGLSVQYYLANAFLLFALDLALTSFAASALSLYRPQAIRYFGTQATTERRTVMWYATVVSALLFALLIAAFLLVGLVMAAYVGPAGWAVVACTVLFAAIGFGTIIWQSPLFSVKIGGGRQNSMPPEMRVYGYFPEKRRDEFTTPTRRGDDDYTRKDGGPVVRGGYTEDRTNWTPTVAPHVPMTGGDVYIEDRRVSRARRTSAPAPNFYEYDYPDV